MDRKKESMAISTGRHEEAFKVLLYDPNPLNREVIKLAIESQTERIDLLVAGTLAEIRSLGMRNRPLILLWSARRLCIGTLFSIGALRLLNRPNRILLLIGQQPSDVDPVLCEDGRDFGVDQVISIDITLADLAACLFRWSTVERDRFSSSPPRSIVGFDAGRSFQK